MKNDTISAILFLGLMLTLPVMAVIQTFAERFHLGVPDYFVYMLALIVSLGIVFSLSPLIERLVSGRGKRRQEDKVVPTRAEIERRSEFAVLLIVSMGIYAIFFETLTQHIPVLQRHHQSGFGVLGSFAGLQFSKILGHRWGWIVDRPIETKTTEKS